MSRKMIAVFAIIPAVLFGGFFMADTFVSSDSSVPAADAEPGMGTETSYTINPDGSKHYTLKLEDGVGVSDSVEATSP